MKQCKIIFSRLLKFLYTVLMHLWYKQFSCCVILTSFICIQHVFPLTTFHWIFSYEINFYINTQPINNKGNIHVQVNIPSWSLDNSHKERSFICIVVTVFFTGYVFLQVSIVSFQACKIPVHALLRNTVFCGSRGSAHTHGSLLWIQFFMLLLENTFHLHSPDSSEVSAFALSSVFLWVWHLQSSMALSYFLSKSSYFYSYEYFILVKV